jgi:hypothetical protein
VCYVCETGGEPVLPLWLKWEAKINMGVYALEWKRSKREFSFHILFQFVFIHPAWVQPSPVISRELIVWTCTRDTYGSCIVRQHGWCCLNIVSALKVILLWKTNWRNVSAAELSYQNVWGLERTHCYCLAWAFLQNVNREGCGHSVCSRMEVIHHKVLKGNLRCPPQPFAILFVHLSFIACLSAAILC